MTFEKDLVREYLTIQKAYEALDTLKVATDKQIESVIALTEKIAGKKIDEFLHKDRLEKMVVESAEILKTAYGLKTIEKITPTYFIDKNGKFFNVKIADLIKLLKSLEKDAEFKKAIKEYLKLQAKEEKEKPVKK